MRQVGSGNELPIQETKRTASAMVDSVLRSPDAFTWLSRVKEKTNIPTATLCVVPFGVFCLVAI